MADEHDSSPFTRMCSLDAVSGLLLLFLCPLSLELRTLCRGLVPRELSTQQYESVGNAAIHLFTGHLSNVLFLQPHRMFEAPRI